MDKKTIVVTGSSGFVGLNLVKRLKKFDYQIIELDYTNNIDLTSWKEVNRIRKIDLIIHLAASVYIPDSYISPREFYYNNMVSTLNMLELCRRENSKIIYVSSYVYGKPQYLPIDEKHPVSSLNPYSRSKVISEQLCVGYNRDFGVPTIIFRPFNIYGPKQNDNFLIPLIQKQIKEKGIIQLKDPRPKRDFIHIDDVVSAYCKSIEYILDLKNNLDFEIFNLGSGISYSVKEVAELLVSKTGKNIPINFSEDQRKGEVLDTVANITKLSNRLNWEPQIEFKQGIKQL